MFTVSIIKTTFKKDFSTRTKHRTKVFKTNFEANLYAMELAERVNAFPIISNGFFKNSWEYFTPKKTFTITVLKGI